MPEEPLPPLDEPPVPAPPDADVPPVPLVPPVPAPVPPVAAPLEPLPVDAELPLPPVAADEFDVVVWVVELWVFVFGVPEDATVPVGTVSEGAPVVLVPVDPPPPQAASRAAHATAAADFFAVDDMVRRPAAPFAGHSAGSR